MKKLISRLLQLSLLLLTVPVNSGAQEPDKTLSPYFVLKSPADGGAQEAFPLKRSGADVKISGTIADVTVTQVYTNTGKNAIEAVYIFPGSTRAAVYGMQMTVGDRVRVAKIQERKEAQKTYDEAKAQGKSASLLEQHRPNVFQMSVANIMPGDEVKVELKYTELLIPADGIYEFVYPTVVGPRYANQPAEAAPASERWVSNPYLEEGKETPYVFSLKLSIDGAVPLQELISKTHKIEPEFESPSKAHVTLTEDQGNGGNKDFILQYRLQGAAIQTGMLLSESADEKFFLLMAQPPKRVPHAAIAPRNYLFVVDVPGSMIGFPLDVSKKLLRELPGKMRPNETFNVLLFSGSSQLPSQVPLDATPENLSRAIALIDSQHGGGGTELLPALRTALPQAAPAGHANSIVLVTDGYVAADRQAFELVRENLNRSSVFSFGIGSSVNRFLIEALARAGQGEAFVATSEEEAGEIAKKFRSYIESPVLTNLKVEFDGMDVFDVEPKTLPDLFAERPIIVYGKYRGTASGKAKITGKNGTNDFLQELPIADIGVSKDASALRYLWARNRVATLSDYGKVSPSEANISEVTKLGLKYNLLTQYTSFVAVDELIRNPLGESVKVKQPLPLPQGVGNAAVGFLGEIGTSPEPETYALLAVLTLLLTLATIHPKLRELLFGMGGH